MDAKLHRVIKKKNGTAVWRALYTKDRPIAQMSGTSVLQKEYIHATDDLAPDYIVGGGTTILRVIKDNLGSVRLVVNTANGGIAERLDYDEWGNVTNDTSPGFQIFGFAGGIYDADAGVVTFGLRDYDPVTGRWTSKDPIRFAGGDTNLYGYVMNDPINFVDPSGQSGTTAVGVGLGGLIGAAAGGRNGGLSGAFIGAVNGALIGGLIGALIDTVQGNASTLSDHPMCQGSSGGISNPFSQLGVGN